MSCQFKLYVYYTGIKDYFYVVAFSHFKVKEFRYLFCDLSRYDNMNYILILQKPQYSVCVKLLVAFHLLVLECCRNLVSNPVHWQAVIHSSTPIAQSQRTAVGFQKTRSVARSLAKTSARPQQISKSNIHSHL